MADKDPWEVEPSQGESNQSQLRSWGQLFQDTPEGPRFQTWPERLVRGVGRDISSLVETMPDVVQGRINLETPEGIEEATRRVTPGVMDILPGAPAVGAKLATRAAAPTAKALQTASKATYEQLKSSDTLLNPIGLDAVHDAIAGALEGENWYGDNNAPGTFKMLAKLKGREGPQTFGEVRKIRDGLSKVGGDREDKAAAKYAQRLIDDYLTQVPTQHIVSGDPVRDAALAREAAANYRGAARTEALEGAVERAQRQAGKSGTGWNLGNTLRQRIDAIINSSKERRYFTDAEIGELRKVVEGSTLQNVARYLGKHAPSGTLSTWPYAAAIAGYETGHGTIGGAAAAIGMLTILAHYTENAITKSAIRKVAERIRADTPLGQSMPQPGYNPLASNILMTGAADALLQSPPDDALR